MVKDVIKVSTVAFNAKWGDKEKNLNRMKGYIEAAASEGANLIVFPEMVMKRIRQSLIKCSLSLQR